MAAELPGYEAASIYGIFAPARTPAAIISRLNEEIAGVLNRAEIRKKLLDAGVEVVGSSPQQHRLSLMPPLHFLKSA